MLIHSLYEPMSIQIVNCSVTQGEFFFPCLFSVQGEFTRASHRVAHIVRPLRQGAPQEIIAIIASTTTILYITLIDGIIRAGIVVSPSFRGLPTRITSHTFQPFPISPRNSPAAVISHIWTSPRTPTWLLISGKSLLEIRTKCYSKVSHR